MKTILQILTFLISLNIFAQTENINSGKYHPAKQVFESEYKIMTFQRFLKNQIKIEKNKVTFNLTKSFEFSEKSSESTKLILTSGLLDPYEINGSYNLKISRIEELTLLNPNPQTKRFSFWIFYSGHENPLLNSVNPHEYYFELQNQNANEKTNFEDFIKGARLTFLKYGGIII